MNTSLSSIGQPITQFFDKYHPTIFFSVIGILLAAAIFILFTSSSIDQNATPTGSQAISSSYDKQTAEKVEKLQQSSDQETAGITLPSPRQSPFVE